ncbi:MAG TPA: DUF58 domain-containing protein [Prosthecobacter sp.]|nr:DUF58 domain-containing protein [Prosthecobacter sp.]
MTLQDDAAALRALQARARDWARVLKLPFRQQRWRGHSGEFMGAGVGSSLDFQDHRVYLPGDDPRQINWQAYARTGTYTMKLYREEVRPLVDLVLDVSASMFAYPDKERRTAEISAYAVEASLQTGATLRCFMVRGQDHALLDTAAVLGGQWLQEVQKMAGADATDAPALSRLPLRTAAMRIFISDLLFPAAPETLLLPLSARNGRGIVFCPFSHEESAPDWDGNYEFIDAETQQPHEHRVEADLLKRYHDAYTRHFELWKSAALRHGVALARVAAAQDFIQALRAEGVTANAVEAA